jgi:glycosyltransferase involved in cell wall biosynthesis
MTMKIAIDISPIVYETGVSRYIKNITKEILRIDGNNNEYTLFGGSFRRFGELKNKVALLKGDAKCSLKLFPFLAPYFANIVFNKFHFLPVEVFTGSIDVFHASDWSQPRSRAFKVTTIHDLSPIFYPKLTHPKIVDAHLSRLKWIKREVDRVIVPSRSSYEDVVKLGIKGNRVRIIPEAVDAELKTNDNEGVKKIKEKYKIYGKYILAVGVNPRKNVAAIIRALGRLRTEIDIRLIVVGYSHEKESSERNVSYLGHVPDSDIPSLYQGAECLVYPSFYEGFGLPILEAYNLKTPVVTSNIGAMKEVGEDAAVLVDPFNDKSVFEGIIKAIKERKSLVKKGLQKASQYSWKQSALMTLDVYKESI